jgi:hypothetical protein
MNSSFVEEQAKAVAERCSGSPEERITELYQTLFQRDPDADERKLGLEYAEGGNWTSYARVLLASNEFTFTE